MTEEIAISTRRAVQLLEITRDVQASIQRSGVGDGICVVYCPHTTAGLAINENADPDVAADLERAFAAAVPKVRFDHGEGNSPAHFLSCVTGASVHIPISGSKLRLGRWQGIFFCEFDGPRTRRVQVVVMGG